MDQVVGQIVLKAGLAAPQDTAGPQGTLPTIAPPASVGNFVGITSNCELPKRFLISLPARGIQFRAFFSTHTGETFWFQLFPGEEAVLAPSRGKVTLIPTFVISVIKSTTGSKYPKKSGPPRFRDLSQGNPFLANISEID